MSRILVLGLMAILAIGCDKDIKDTDKSNPMYYGDIKWGSTYKEVLNLENYEEPKFHGSNKKFDQSIYYRTFQGLQVECYYFYTKKDEIYNINFEFGHIDAGHILSNRSLKGSNYGTFHKSIGFRRETPGKMLHTFNLLVQNYNRVWFEGKTTDNSEEGNFDIEHVWENDISKWSLSLKTDNRNYHRLTMVGFHKRLNEEVNELYGLNKK